MATLPMARGGLMGLWLDTGLVTGHEVLGEYDAASASTSEVVSVSNRAVRGWAFDLGVNVPLPLAYEPRLFTAYAKGSGGQRQGSHDHSFRQTDLAPNQSGFGGRQRFQHYGLALEPELSNLAVITAGAGVALAQSSSLDLVYHRYRMVDVHGALRTNALAVSPDGQHRDLGWGLDLVLALEEWERMEFELTAATFHAGSAFGADAGKSSYSAFAAMRWAL